MRRLIHWLTGALIVAPAAHAQVVEKKVLTLAGAQAVAAAAVGEARRIGAGGVIAVVDDGGHLIYLERLDNTQIASVRVAIGKAHTAALFRRPTKDMETWIETGRTAFLAVADVTPLKAGIPLKVGDAVVGAVGVSGSLSADADEQIAEVAANVVLH